MKLEQNSKLFWVETRVNKFKIDWGLDGGGPGCYLEVWPPHGASPMRIGSLQKQPLGGSFLGVDSVPGGLAKGKYKISKFAPFPVPFVAFGHHLVTIPVHSSSHGDLGSGCLGNVAWVTVACNSLKLLFLGCAVAP